MIDITSYDVINKGLLIAVHIFCVFIIAIMMINFLIAIMTNTAGKIMEHRQTIQNIITIWLCWQIESRRALTVSYFYKKLIHKYMKYEDGHVYVFDVSYVDPIAGHERHVTNTDKDTTSYSIVHNHKTGL